MDGREGKKLECLFHPPHSSITKAPHPSLSHPKKPNFHPPKKKIPWGELLSSSLLFLEGEEGEERIGGFFKERKEVQYVREEEKKNQTRSYPYQGRCEEKIFFCATGLLGDCLGKKSFFALPFPSSNLCNAANNKRKNNNNRFVVQVAVYL